MPFQKLGQLLKILCTPFMFFFSSNFQETIKFKILSCLKSPHFFCDCSLAVINTEPGGFISYVGSSGFKRLRRRYLGFQSHSTDGGNR